MTKKELHRLIENLEREVALLHDRVNSLEEIIAEDLIGFDLPSFDTEKSN